jgi:adenylate cyclase class 2
VRSILARMKGGAAKRATAKRETEVKLRLASAAAGRRLLRSLGARAASRVFERNFVFDTPNGLLFAQSRLLRIRTERPIGKSASHNRAGRALLTHKGPGLAERSPYKVREETELELSDAGAMQAVLESLGLRVKFRYEKRRTAYRLPGEPRLVVELDETPIGAFLELEGSPRAIDRIARRLGFSPADYLTASYLALYFADCARRGIAPADMVFRRAK